ncbi:MAG: T9SS type A sorting domain-containing protein, partial [Candidatus Marinimicrobia bacterium]|nr:T9SS type A sorting domain-containing protein [Candidatus Neomarinimicrobiota bacterium]
REDCGGTGPDTGCDGVCFSEVVEDCLGECGGFATEDCLGACNGIAFIDECGVCDGGNVSCSGCTDSVADNYDPSAIVDDASCTFPPIEIVEPEELTSYDSSVDVDVPEVILTDITVDIDIPAGALDIPEGTEVTLEASEVSEGELQDIVDNSSSSDAGVEVFEGVSFEATDENGDPIELAEGATLDVEITFSPNRNEYDLGYITADGEIVALSADCFDNGDGTWTCLGDGPGFGSYIVYSFDPVATIAGCTIMAACNYNADATMNDGTCSYPVEFYECDGTCTTDTDADGVCDELEVGGCTDITASNFDSQATDDNGTCEYGYELSMSLSSGNNLISLPGYFDNSNSQDLMNNIINDGTDVVFLLGQGLGLFNTNTGWSGNLTNVNPFSGYWINTTDVYNWDLLFEGGALQDCESYTTSSGNNLMSYKWGQGSSSTMDALGGEAFASANFNFILGQGLGLFNTADGWSGNLTNLVEGKGYWVNISEGVADFKWGFDNCGVAPLGRASSEFINPNELMYDEFKFIQSTEQAFYLIKEISINGIEPSYNDVVLAYNNDLLVGSTFWAGKHTAVPVMGRDLSDNTVGFSENGDEIQFKLYSVSTGEIYELDGSVETWSTMLVSSVNKLTGSSLEIPQVLTVNPAFPNPFNPVTKLSFGIPTDGMVSVNVFDVNGRLVSTIQNGMMDAGSYEIEWNGNNQPSGMYLVKIQFDDQLKTEKIMLVK